MSHLSSPKIKLPRSSRYAEKFSFSCIFCRKYLKKKKYIIFLNNYFFVTKLNKKQKGQQTMNDKNKHTSADCVNTAEQTPQENISSDKFIAGRSSRLQFWLILILLNIMGGLLALLPLLGCRRDPCLFWIFLGLLFLPPVLMIHIRRLHDINASGWLVLIRLIPLFGRIFSIVLGCIPSYPQTNKYGIPANLKNKKDSK